MLRTVAWDQFEIHSQTTCDTQNSQTWYEFQIFYCLWRISQTARVCDFTLQCKNERDWNYEDDPADKPRHVGSHSTPHLTVSPQNVRGAPQRSQSNRTNNSAPGNREAISLQIEAKDFRVEQENWLRQLGP